MFRRLAAILIVPILLTAACGGDDEPAAAPTTTEGAAGEQTFEVRVDAEIDEFNAGFLAYFPKSLQAHPGDTVEFTAADTGEPHTVAMGTLIDAAIAKAAELEGQPGAEEAPPPPELEKIPGLITEEGPPAAIQAGAQPCYLATGEPSKTDACPDAQQEPTPFTGEQTFYNSGWVEPDEPFSVELSADIAPGTYGYYCLLHGTGMSGEITVADEGTEIPGPDEATSAGDKDLEEATAELQPAVDPLAQATNPDLGPLLPTGPDKVLAGTGLEASDHLISEFGPKEVSIVAGGSVTWTVVGPHTISFDAPEDASPLLVREADGTVNINEKSIAPAGGPGAPPPPEGPPPEGPPPPPQITDGGSYAGSGFRSSGLFLSFPPLLQGFKLTFPTAGTYTYSCVIHPDMEGTVTVG